MSAPLYSWGRYPQVAQQGHDCEAVNRLPAHISETLAHHHTSLPFGNGRSYGDSCLASSGHVLDMRKLDRFIAADWQNGVVQLEAGMTLSQLLAAAIPRGWFLPVTPGTQFVTIGGALANDVHGKNHHLRGTFGCHVMRFELIRHGEPPMVCSAVENPLFFAASIGGLGLTGVISRVELQLMPIRTS
ncbi:FAD-binding oxidoreductase, partial [Pseudomonas amygdali]